MAGHAWHPVEDDVDGDRLFERVRAQRMGARQVDQLQPDAVVRHLTYVPFHGHAGVVADPLTQTG